MTSSPGLGPRGAPTRRVLVRYLLFQIPGWVAVAGGLAAAVRWWDLTPGWAVAGFALWLAKDAALFPLLRRAYEPDGLAPHGPVAGEGVADTAIDPEGWVRVGPERWRARRALHGAPIAPGSRIRVLAVRGHELVVEAED